MCVKMYIYSSVCVSQEGSDHDEGEENEGEDEDSEMEGEESLDESDSELDEKGEGQTPLCSST